MSGLIAANLSAEWVGCEYRSGLIAANLSAEWVGCEYIGVV